VEQLADTLKIARGLAEEAVGQLARAGVIEVKLAGQEEQYRGPRADFRSLVERLSQVYEQNRFEVIMLMSANAIERVRTGALRAFADAFLIRRKG
jgi:hypothetical protein